MVEELAPAEVARKLRDAPGSVVLLDVREPWERSLAVIEPSLHIPMNQIVERESEIPKDKPLVVYCHGGARSLMVASYLAHHGHPGAANLEGGIDAWSLKVDSKVPRYD